MAGPKDTKLKGKMNRSETVSIRLDPRLNYLCELAARSQRRSKSSFIEATIAEKIQSMTMNNPNCKNDNDTFGQFENYLWQVEEHDRLVSLGLQAPHLLTFEEQELWTLVSRTGFFWKGKFGGANKTEWQWTISEGSMIRERVEKYWDLLNQICEGAKNKSDLPSCAKTSSGGGGSGFGQQPSFGGSGSDDEIPF